MLNMNRTVQIVGGLTAVMLVGLFVGLFIVWHDYRSEEWQRRQYFPMPVGDGCQLLDRTLGKHAREPQALFDVLAWHFEGGPNPYNLGLDQFCDVQHQALIRLLDLQGTVFHTSVAPPSSPCTGVDHTYAVERSRDTNLVVIEGTPTLRPTHWDRPWEGYYDEETLEFAPDGRLLSRKAHRE